MSEESKIKDTAEAVKGLVQAVPVYQDALQPAVREIGAGLQTVAKTIHIALAPISALVWGYDQIKDFVSTRVAENLKDIPSERIQTPEPHIVGPALEALRYCGHQEDLREMYANLLATALDTETAKKAHPAFVDIINNMSPDEARIMRLFAVHIEYPLIDVEMQYGNFNQGYDVVYRSFSTIGTDAKCSIPDLTPCYLDNLTRLGLVQSPGAHTQDAPFLVGQNLYEPLEESHELQLIRDQVASQGKRVDYRRRFIRLTDLGQLFCRACVLEKSTAAL